MLSNQWSDAETLQMLNSTGYRFKQCDINVMREMNKIEEAIGAAADSPERAKALFPLDNNEINPAMLVGPYHQIQTGS